MKQKARPAAALSGETWETCLRDYPAFNGPWNLSM
jgi:hypothetical protein